MKKITKTRAILIFLTIAILGGLVYVFIGVLGERTIIPATEYDDSPEVETQVASSTNNGSTANDTSRQITDTTIPQAVVVKGKTAKGKDTTYTVYTTVPSSTTNPGLAEQTFVVVGRKLGPSDFHINHKLNARL